MASQKLTLSTHDSLIQKLESILSTKDNDSMYKQTQLALRLADLYAERARLLSLEKEGKGDLIYKDKIEADRTKAINIYLKITPKLKSEEKGRVLLQTAHLFLLMQKQDDAVKIYANIIERPLENKKETLAIAHIQWADILFYKGNFEKSSKHFRDSLKIKDNPRQGYARYRDSWCQYNLGKTREAQNQLISLLKNKSLFLKSSDAENTVAVDNSFQEEVSRDLATFMARNDIIEPDIILLSNLSPDSTKQKNLVYLATELDRTAKKESALLVWSLIGKQNVDFVSQLEGQIQITRIQYDLGRKAKLLLEIDRSISLIKGPACVNIAEDCALATQGLKKILTEWGKAEERAPSPELIIGFSKYSNAFDDAEMSYWSASASLKRKLYIEAFNSFKKAAELFSKMTPVIDGSDLRLKKMFESSLLSAIEAAERSEDPLMQLSSYRLYLTLNPKGPKRDEIKYQIGHIFYDNEDYQPAADLFRQIAIDINAPAGIREKSSELCLDSLVLLKNEIQIETDSLLFSQTFKTRSKYFLAIWRKSVLNQSAAILNNSHSTKEQLETELSKLDKIIYSEWPIYQKKILLKNKLEIGLQLKNIDMVLKSSNQYLALNDLNIEEKNWALTQAAWVAEMQMDFKKSWQLLSLVKPTPSKLANHYFKMALLLELSHQDPSNDYLKFMKVSKDENKKQYAAYQLIIFSQQPKKIFTKYIRLLKNNPQLFTAASLYIYEKSSDEKIAKALLTNKSLKNTFEVQLLARSIELTQFKLIQKKLANTPFSNQSDQLIQNNLVKRIKLIKKLEKLSQIAIQKKDTLLQLVLLTQVQYENSRLAQDILALPSPKNLPTGQKNAYQEQINVQIKPYFTQSIVVKEKVVLLWNSAIKNAVFKDIFDRSEETSAPGNRLAKAEIEILKTAALMSGIKDDPFINFSQVRHKMTAEASLLEKSIMEDPFNFNDIEKLKSLQKALGRGPMVAYLESRSGDLNLRGGRN